MAAERREGLAPAVLGWQMRSTRRAFLRQGKEGSHNDAISVAVHRRGCAGAKNKSPVRVTGPASGFFQSRYVYVWIMRGVMKKISSWLLVFTAVRLNRLPSQGMLPSNGT